MSSDDVLSSGLKSGGYSSNATTASMFWNNSADSLEYTIYSNTSVGNNATSDHTVDYVFSMPAWSQCIMYSLFLFLVRVAVRSTIPDARFQEVSQLRRLREERFATLRKDPDARRLAIENGLITKRVVSCAENCTFILGDLDGSVLDDTHSIHTTDKSSSPCSICLELFQVSDSVTWSRADVCRHVFHTDCIHEWFSNPKHEDCPLCRAQIIYLDQSDDEIKSDNNDAGILYTVMDGLVSTMSNPASWITGEGDSTEPSKLPISSQLVASDQVSHLGQTLELGDDESMEGIAEPVVFRSGLFATRA